MVAPLTAKRAAARARDTRIKRAEANVLDIARIYGMRWEAGVEASSDLDTLGAAARELVRTEKENPP